MGEPDLYQWYDRSEAIAPFGPEAEARTLCDGQWVLFPDVVLCLAEVGDSPRASHFTNGGTFCWVADKPYRVSDWYVKFVPRVVVGVHAKGLTIHLFVRKGGAARYLYVGKLDPACRFSASGRDNHGGAFFDLSPALLSEVWLGLGGLRLGDLDHAAVDAALDHLRHPINVEGRLWVLQQLVTYWHGLTRPEDGFREEELEGLAVPRPLRWWYGWAGRRRTVMSGQNILLDPDQLRVREGLLQFYVENQYCYQWGTLCEGDDPPVFGRENDADPWEPEGITLSEQLILACLFEAIMCHCPYGASASWLEGPIVDRIIEHIPPIAIGPWRWGGSARLHARGGAFMVTMPNGEIDGKRGDSVWIGAKTEHPLWSVKPYIEEDWEYVAV